jgi:hypothetical protein
LAAEGLFSRDVFCDFTPPKWRVQVQGAEGVVALRHEARHRAAVTLLRA